MNQPQLVRARDQLTRAVEQLPGLLAAANVAGDSYEEWVNLARRAIVLGLGEQHPLAREFEALTMVHVGYAGRLGESGSFERHEERVPPHNVLRRGKGILEDAIAIVSGAIGLSGPAQVEEHGGVFVSAAALQPEDAKNAATSVHPKAFISYAWEGTEVQQWVLDLATELRSRRGVDVILDVWQLHPGDQMPEFMERAVREADVVLIVCTPSYKKKSEGRTGGVGYEGHIMTAELYQKNNQRKFLPVLRVGDHHDALPSWLAGKRALDLRGDGFGKEFAVLIDVLHRRLPTAPPIGDEFPAGSGDASIVERPGSKATDLATGSGTSSAGQSGGAHAEGDRSVAIGGNVTNSRISTGDSNTSR